MKQLEQCLNLFWSQQTPMIVAPDILSKIEGQPFSADSPFGCQTPLEITPEALQAVDVAPLPIAERLAVVHKPVDVAPRCDARVAGKGVRADDGATLHALVQERQQRLGFHVSPNPPMRSGLGVGTRGEGRGTRRSALDSDKWGRWRPLVGVGGADGGPGQRRWGGVGGTACKGRQSRTGPVRLCGVVE